MREIKTWAFKDDRNKWVYLELPEWKIKLMQFILGLFRNKTTSYSPEELKGSKNG